MDFLDYKIKDKLFDKINNKNYKLNIFVIFIIFSLICLIPVFTIDVYSNDLAFHIYRIISLADNLKDGVVLSAPQAQNMAGWGYNLAVFYPSGCLYPFALLNMLGVHPVICFYVLVFVFNLLTCVINYKAMFKFSNKQNIAFYFALFCLLNPLRIMELSLSGFLGSFLALTFMPLVILGTIDLVENNKWSMLAFGMIGLVNTHLISLFLSAIFVFVYCCFNYKVFIKTKNKILQLIKAAVASVCAGTWFLIPFIYHYTSDTFKLVYNAKLSGIISLDNFNVHWIMAICFQIFLIILLIIINKFLYSKLKSKILTVSLCITIWGVVSLTTLFPWELMESIPFIKSIQSPTRILCIITIFVVFLLLDISLSVKDMNIIILAFLISLQFTPAILTNVLQEIPEENVEQTELMAKYEDYKDLPNAEEGTYFNVIASEYIPLEFSLNNKEVQDIKIEDLVPNKIPVFSEVVDYEYSRDNLITTIIIKEDKNVDIIVPLIYYVNYRAYLNGEEIDIQELDGKIFIENVSRGELVVKYEVQPFEHISAIFSLISFVYLIYLEKKSTQST